MIQHDYGQEPFIHIWYPDFPLTQRWCSTSSYVRLIRRSGHCLQKHLGGNKPPANCSGFAMFGDYLMVYLVFLITVNSLEHCHSQYPIYILSHAYPVDIPIYFRFDLPWYMYFSKPIYPRTIRSIVGLPSFIVWK